MTGPLASQHTTQPPDPRRVEVQLLGSAVLLQGLAIRDACTLIQRGIRQSQRQDGISPHPRLLYLIGALEAAAQQQQPVSPERHNDVAGMHDQPHSLQANEIDSRQVAALLNIGVRQVQRTATSIGGRKIGGTWIFERTDVEAYEQQRGTP